MCLFGWRRPYPSLLVEYERAQAVAWQRCPVCHGRGSVPHDFYTQFGSGTSTLPHSCRTCGGGGIVQMAPSGAKTPQQACGRLLVGQGDDTYDPECVLPAGHEPPCAPTATPEGEYARNQREAVEHIQTLPPSERSAVENRPGQTPPTTPLSDSGGDGR